MMIHKSLRNQRIQNAYTDGVIDIVKKEPKRDQFNTIIPGQSELTTLGSYGFHFTGIHSQDKIEFGNEGVELERELRIPMNLYIHSGMTAILNHDETTLYDIVKVFPDFTKDELEILLAKEGGHYNTKE